MTDTPRRHRFHSDDHTPTDKETRREKLVTRQRQANNRDEAFGKINWAAYRHDQLWDMIKSAEPSKLGEQAYRWGRLAEGVDTTTADVRTVVQRLLLSWKGPSAVKAAESVSALTKWGADAGINAREVGDGLDAYTSAIGEAQRSMPEPVHYYAERWFREGYDVKALDGPNGAYMMDDLLDDHLPKKAEADKAKNEAIRVMEQYEAASKTVHTTLPPAFDQAPAVTSVGTDNPAPRTPTPQPTPVENPDPVTTPERHDVQPVAANLDQPGNEPDDTTTASAVPSFGSGPASVGGTGTYGSFGGVGAPGVIGGGLEEGNRFGWAPGGAVAAGSAAAGTGAAARGMGGFGMYPPGTGARREEDTEHHDRYADGYDLMDDLPVAYPPVFGE
jgi:hypothetical protein